MFYPIGIIIEEDTEEEAVAIAEALAAVLILRYGEELLYAALFAGTETMPEFGIAEPGAVDVDMLLDADLDEYIDPEVTE